MSETDQGAEILDSDLQCAQAQTIKSYDGLFAIRGSAYDRAMRSYPEARRQEFRQAIERVELAHGMAVADVPAGGGYLQRYLPSGCEWRPHEPCASFTNHHAAPDDPANAHLLPLPWPEASIDAAFSIAGVHHLEDKRPLFAELHRVVKPGGVFLLSDVATDSAVAHFLDEYVGAYNSTGHEGVFLDERTVRELQDTGWQVESCEQVDFPWVFPDLEGMAKFCHQLFDLQRSRPADTSEAITQRLGVSKLPDGVGMNWSLMTIRARRI